MGRPYQVGQFDGYGRDVDLEQEEPERWLPGAASRPRVTRTLLGCRGYLAFVDPIRVESFHLGSGSK